MDSCRSNIFVNIWIITSMISGSFCWNSVEWTNSLQTIEPPSTLPPLFLCSLSNYNTNNLTIWPWSWSFTAEVFCQPSQNISKTCVFEFVFCNTLPRYVSSNTSCDGASVCQIDTTESTKAIPFGLGKYEATKPQFVASTFNYKRPIGFIAPFSNGKDAKDAKINETKQLSTLILFECDDTVPWVASLTDNPTPIPAPTEVTWDDHEFSYWISVKYAGACLTLVPSSPNDEMIYISVGSVIIIIAVCSLTLYCSVGFIAKTCMGKNGVEAIPNHSTWRELPSYTRDGIAFAFSCCQSPRQPLSREYQEHKEGYDSI